MLCLVEYGFLRDLHIAFKGLFALVGWLERVSGLAKLKKKKKSLSLIQSYLGGML